MSKDEIIIVNAYLNTEFKVKLAIDCIKQLKKTGIEIMVTSHYHIPKNVTDLVDYYVYDYENSLITNNGDMFWFGDPSGTKFFKKHIHSSHSFSALSSLFNGLYLAKSKGKKYFHHIEYDTILTDENIEELKGFRSKLNGKRGILDLCKLNSENEGISMLYIFSEVDIFLNEIKLPKTKDEYVKYCKNQLNMIASEAYLHNRLKNYLDNYIVGKRTKDHISFLDNETTAMSKNESLDTFHECDITKRKGSDEFYFVYINRSEKNQIIYFNGRDKVLHHHQIFYRQVEDDVNFTIKTNNGNHFTKKLIFDKTTSNRDYKHEYIEF